MTSKTLMQKAAAQWMALRKMADAARGVLPKDEGDVVVGTTKEGAERSLDRLNARRDKALATPPRSLRAGEDPEPDFDDEPTEVRALRRALTEAAEGV